MGDKREIIVDGESYGTIDIGDIGQPTQEGAAPPRRDIPAEDAAWRETAEGKKAIAHGKDLAAVRKRCGIRPDEAHKRAVAEEFDLRRGDSPCLNDEQLEAFNWTVAIREAEFGLVAYRDGWEAGAASLLKAARGLGVDVMTKLENGLMFYELRSIILLINGEHQEEVASLAAKTKSWVSNTLMAKAAKVAGQPLKPFRRKVRELGCQSRAEARSTAEVLQSSSPL
jgi:hypothetical protein